MKVEIAQVFGRDYIRISGGKKPGEIAIDINEAEELWQELMIKCQEYRMTTVEEIEN